jgi:hypothetical protein
MRLNRNILLAIVFSAFVWGESCTLHFYSGQAFFYIDGIFARRDSDALALAWNKVLDWIDKGRLRGKEAKQAADSIIVEEEIKRVSHGDLHIYCQQFVFEATPNSQNPKWDSRIRIYVTTYASACSNGDEPTGGPVKELPDQEFDDLGRELVRGLRSNK